MRVLVVEDSEKLQRTVRLALRKAGYVVDVAIKGDEGLWMARENGYDAVVLDLMLPGMDGLSVLRQFRAGGGQTPVLILTVKAAVEDRVVGLRAGADDYLTKPFALEELVARVDSLVRRRYGERSPAIRSGDFELNTAARTASRDGELLNLTPREYRLLELLVLRRGHVISRPEIEECLYGDEVELFSNVVESTISSLRKKLDPEGTAPLIQTRRGMGYVFDPGTDGLDP